VRRAPLLLVLALVTVGVAQPPPVSFTLSTNRTFGPDEKPRIMVQAQNVKGLDFRLYRVNDPVAFLAKLPDAHRFGGQGAETPVARTPLERLHRWKQRMRYSMRRLIRDQFGDAEHQQLIAWLGRQQRQPSKDGAVRLAEVPLLNPQQVVRTWRVPIETANPWDTQQVEFDAPGEGLYVVEAVGEGLRAATIVNVTSLVLIEKSFPGRVMVRALDHRSGQGIPSARLVFVPPNGNPQERQSGPDGGAEFTDVSQGTLVAVNGKSMAMVSIMPWATRRQEDALALGYVYTDRPIYRPGDAIGFRGILRGETPAGWKIPEVKEVSYELTGPEGETIERKNLALSRYGTVNATWTSPRDAKLGYYSILLRAGDSTQAGSFQIEEYKKPEYEVKAIPGSARVLQGEAAAWTIEAKYFFGEPVANAKVKYTIRRTRHWNWYGDFEPEDFEEGEVYMYGELAREGETRLNAEGRAVISLPTRSAKFDEDYRIEVLVTDQAKREIPGRGLVLATVGPYFLTASPEKYVYAPGEAIRVRVDARNYDGKPASGVRFSIGSVSGVTNDNGAATVTLPPAAPGSHQMQAESRSAGGRVVRGDFWLWVTGSYSSSERRNSIEIVPDQKSYRPGDTAKILVVTGEPDASVWIGIEGRGLSRQEKRQVTGSSFIYELPITRDHSPNIYLTATFLKQGRYYTGSKSIRVPSDRVLNVKLTPSKPSFKPGEPARYTVEATTQSGQPAAAEFSLGVIDEAVYGVAPDTTPAIDKAFYGRTYNRVMTNSSLSFYFYGQAGTRAMPLARNRQGALAQMKPPRPNDPRVRKDFRDTAYWSPAIETNAQGRAEVVFQFPDSITAWRATARGVTAETEVGAAVERTISRKDLILRVAAPRFLTQGDETVVSAIVNNYLSSAKNARITIAAKGAELLDGAERQGLAGAGVETPFAFRLRARAGERVTLTVKALTDEESDAMEIDIPVLPYGVKVTQAFSGTLSGRLQQKVNFPPDAAAKTIEIRAMPSLAGAMFGGIEYLTSYPYGCTEQTLSSFAPTYQVLQALTALKLPVENRRRMEQQVAAGQARLAEMQHPDGGWGFWPSDDSSAYMTANVVAVLEEQNNWGLINRDGAREWLTKAFDREKRADPDFRAWIAYGLRDAKIVAAAWDARELMSPYGWAVLGLVQQGAARAAAIARLERDAIVTGEEAYWRSLRDNFTDMGGDASVEATSYALRLLIDSKPDSPLVEKAVRWLLNQRTDGYYWMTTRRSASVIGALTGFLKLSGELDPKLAVEIRANGESVWNKELTQPDALAPHAPGIKLGPRASENTIDLEASGRGKLYWSITASHYDPKPRLDRSGTLSIERQYQRLLAGGGRQAFDGIAQTGDVIVSRVTVRGEGLRYLMVEDPIPAGAEIDPSGDWYGGHREFRDDRAATFFDTFNSTIVIETRLKIVRPGRYRISPARATPMYQPGILASSDASSMEVR
jgi:uncharacterized protein YfaS (alpha-2-macroglobulin family)